MFEKILAAVSTARTPGEGVRACARLENAACASRLGHMADMLDAAYAASGSAQRDQWRFDNWSSVCAQIGAAHEVTSGVASALLTDAVVLRERLPRVAAVFAEGLISYRLVHAICTRTMLVKDPDALCGIDAELAERFLTWGAKSRERSESDIDELVLRHDPYAVRRTESACRGAYVDVQTDSANGVRHVTATVLASDGEAFDTRADALARRVCDRDPRTLDQRRAAALSAMAFSWDRLPCVCESEGCDAATKPAGGGVVIHVIARQDIVDAAQPGAGDEPAAAGSPEPAAGDLTSQRRALAGENPPLLPRPWQSYTLSALVDVLAADRGELCPARPAKILGGTVIPAPVAAQVAMHATITPLIHPGQAPQSGATGHPASWPTLSGAEIKRAGFPAVRDRPRSPTSTTPFRTRTGRPARRIWLVCAGSTISSRPSGPGGAACNRPTAPSCGRIPAVHRHDLPGEQVAVPRTVRADSRSPTHGRPAAQAHPRSDDAQTSDHSRRVAQATH